MKISIMPGLLVAVLLPLLGLAADAPTAAIFDNPVIVRGKGLEIRRSQLEDEFIRVKAQMATQGRTLTPEERSTLEINLLQRLIGVRLVNGQATEAERAAAQETATKRFDEIKTRLGSEELMNLRLKAENLTPEQLMTNLTDQATAEAVLERELKVVVTDEEAKKFYDENPSKFEQPEMVRASHILFSTRDKNQRELSADQKAAKRKEAEAVLKRAKAGEDFAALAKEFSDDPGSKDKGGEYTFPRGRMVPEFEAAAWALNPGQVSDIITTTFGYHIIKLGEKIPAKKVEYATVAEDLKKGLKVQEIQKRIPAYLDKLKEQAGVEILDEKLKPTAAAGKSANAELGIAK